MQLLLSMPGGSEWILILFFLAFVIVVPILAIVFYLKSKRLENDLMNMTAERNELLKRVSR